MKFTDIFKKLGAKYVIETDVSMKAMAGENTAGFYNVRTDVLHVMEEYKPDGLNDGLSSMGAAATNYVAMHELIHWTSDRVGRVWNRIIGTILVSNKENARMMEEAVAESGSEKLEKDLMHEDVSYGVAERLNTFIQRGMPPHFLDEAIKEGEQAAEYIEEQLNARPEQHTV